MSPMKQVSIGPITEETEDTRAVLQEGSETSIEMETIKDSSKEDKKKKKKNKKKDKKSKEEDLEENADKQDGGFVLSEEEMKNRGFEMSPEEKRIHQKHKTAPSCKDHFIFSPTLRIFYVVVVCVVAGIAIPFVLTQFAFDSIADSSISGDCIINTSYRISCRDGESLSSENCLNIGCCYDESNFASDPYIPRCYHRLPSVYGFSVESNDISNELDDTSYRLANKSSMTFNMTSRNLTTIYKTDAWRVVAMVQRLSDDSIRVVINSPGNDDPLPFDNFTGGVISRNYSLDVLVQEDNNGGGFTLTIFRVLGSSDGEESGETPLFQSYFGPMEYGEGYVEFAAKVPSQHIYGLGQRDSAYLLPNFEQWDKWPLMNGETSSTHGVFPFYLLREPSGCFHGALLKNSAPMEVGVLPAPSIVFKTMRGYLDFRFFGGPTPRDVLKQYAGEIGFPSMPPYWALGYHLCRSTYEKDPVESYRNVSRDMEDAAFPYESDCINGRLTYPDSFSSLPADVVSEIEAMQTINRKFLLVGHPFLGVGTNVYGNASQEDFLVKLSENASYFGKIDSSSVAYPDFFNDRIVSEWLFPTSSIRDRYEAADGVILFRNSPLNEAKVNFTVATEETLANCTSDNPEWCCTPYELPFVPDGLPEEVTNSSICWRAEYPSSGASHISLHNFYGSYHALRIKQLMEAIQNTGSNADARQFILSSSVFPGAPSGFMPESYAPDFVSQQKALTQVLLMGLNGIPVSGTPLCGSRDTQDESLRPEWCLRAHQNAVLLPLAFSYYEENQSARNPSVSTAQNFTSSFVENLRTFVRLRYLFLPYLYTLFHEASTTGAPIARPLFYEFPDDQASLEISGQYMAGSGLLVTPTLTSQGTTSLTGSDVTAHFPPGIWYDYYTGELFINSTNNGSDVTFTVMSLELNIHLRAGYVIPLQGDLNNDGLLTTSDWRKSSFIFVVGLNPSDASTGSSLASGYMYLDDGITPLDRVSGASIVRVEAYSESLTIVHEGTFCSENSQNFNTKVDVVRIFGSASIDTDSVTVNGNTHRYSTQDSVTGAIELVKMSVDFCDFDVEIRWKLI